MKQVTLRIVLGLCLCITLFGNDCHCATWLYVTNSGSGANYIDTDSLKTNNMEKLITVWIKTEYNSETIKQEIERGKKYGKDVNGISYANALYQINYEYRIVTIMEVTQYAKNGNKLQTVEGTSQIKHIVPGSVMEKILNKILELDRTPR
jgi:hypothetical protein